MGPFDFFRERWNNIQAHPWQNALGVAAGALIPGGGLLVNALSNRYNDNQFNNAAQQLQDRSLSQTTMDANDAMNAPLSGPLGDYDRAHPYGESSPSGGRDQQDRQLADALTGGGGGQNAGGYAGGYQSPGQWTQQSISGWNPNQANASQAFGLLDFLGPNPNGSGGMSHQDIKDMLESRSNMGGGGMMNPAIYGVSNFMVGGSPVINGVRPAGGDMNGLALWNPRLGGG